MTSSTVLAGTKDRDTTLKHLPVSLVCTLWTIHASFHNWSQRRTGIGINHTDVSVKLLLHKVGRQLAVCENRQNLAMTHFAESTRLLLADYNYIYTQRCTVTTRVITYALEWAAVKAIFKFRASPWRAASSHKTVSITTTFEEKGEPKRESNRCRLLTSLMYGVWRLTSVKRHNY